MKSITLSLAGPLLLAVGCCPCPKTGEVTTRRLNPPTESMAAVVAAINSNNQKVPTLWARLNYSADINDNGRMHSVSSSDGILLYRTPTDMRLVGKKEFVGTVFDLGSSARQYWLEVVPGTNRMWWGTYADLAKLNPERLPIPIQPNLVLEVLGIGTINTDFNALPAPTMVYNNAADAYVFVFNARAPFGDRWLAVKEVWYDRRSKRPRRIFLYDVNGRPVLQADLSMDVRVQVPDAPQNTWPIVPGDYKLFFPDSGSKMEFTVTEALLYKVQGRRHIPDDASFKLPDVEGTDVQAVQIGAGGRE